MKNDFDGTFDNFNNPDTPLNVSTSEQFRLGFSQSTSTKRGSLNSSFNTIQRNYNTFNSYSNSVDYSDYKSKCQCGCIQQIFF
jgi:vitamin B12 transporter